MILSLPYAQNLEMDDRPNGRCMLSFCFCDFNKKLSRGFFVKNRVGDTLPIRVCDFILLSDRNRQRICVSPHGITPNYT